MSPSATDSRTILWEGMFATQHSFAFVNRALCTRLIQRGHRLSLQPSGLAESEATTLADHPYLAPHVRQPLSGDVLHISHRWPPRLQPPQSQQWVVIQPWEFGSLPITWLHAMNEEADAVWVYSNYLRDCYLRSGVDPERLHVVPLGVEPARFHPDAPPRTLATRKGFRFLFVGGTIHRKGIDVLLDAYRHAFTAKDDVCLVLKDFGTRSFYRGQTAHERPARWSDDPDAPELEYLDGDWPDDELPGLYTACDCLVAPYRGEGFGLPIAEALACGRPAIVTNHGASLDFCNPDNAYLIPAREVFLPHRRIGDLKTVGQPWLAEPDRDALIDLLRHVAGHTQEAHSKGQTGAALIRDRFTWDHTARRVEELLIDLARQPARPAVSVRADASRSVERPRVSLTMIVKNEKATLGQCLASVRDLVGEIIVVDTGSSDRTKEIAAQYGARVFDFAWCDSFAAARNEALNHATGEWILWLDADEYFDDANRDKLRRLLASLDHQNAAFVMKQSSPSQQGGSAMLVDQVRLFRNLPAIRWDYRVHEQILLSVRRAGHEVHFTDISLTHTGYVDPALRRSKLERNLRLLYLDLAERPQDAFTLFNLGWAYTDHGRHAEAIPYLQRSLEHSRPADSITPKLYALLTQSHRKLGQLREAHAVCRAGRIRCPEDAELLFVEGQLAHELGDRATARSCWQRLLASANGSTNVPAAPDCFTSVDAGLRGHLVHYHLAVLCREEGRDSEAEAHWQASLAEAPGLVPAWMGLGELYLQQERWSQLEQVVAQLHRHPPMGGEAAVLQARACLARREFAAARQVLEGIIAHDPAALKPRVILSHVLLQSGDEDAAAPLLRSIVQLDPTQAESWRNLAVLLGRRGKLHEAVEIAQAGRQHCPHDPDLLLTHGVFLRESGELARAETCLLAVLESTASDGATRQRAWRARHNLALLYREQKRLPEAAAHWRALLSENPDLETARRCLAEVYLAQGRILDLEPLVTGLPAAAPETALLRARLHLARRQFPQARQLLETLLGRFPRLLEGHVLLSYVHLQEGRDPDAAERALQNVLELDPDNAEARHNLYVLKQQLTPTA